MATTGISPKTWCMIFMKRTSLKQYGILSRYIFPKDKYGEGTMQKTLSFSTKPTSLFS